MLWRFSSPNGRSNTKKTIKLNKQIIIMQPLIYISFLFSFITTPTWCNGVVTFILVNSYQHFSKKVSMFLMHTHECNSNYMVLDSGQKGFINWLVDWFPSWDLEKLERASITWQTSLSELEWPWQKMSWEPLKDMRKECMNCSSNHTLIGSVN